MSDFAILYNKLYIDRVTKDPKTFIDIYDANRMYIENQDTSSSNPNFRDLVQIIADYGIALSFYGSTTKAIPYLDKADRLFKEYAELNKKEDVLKSSMYERLVWERGKINYGLKKYNLSAKDFQYLVDTFPDNDKYREGLMASRTIKSKKIINSLWMAAAVLFIWYSFVTKDGDKLRDYFLMALIVCIIVAVVMEIMNSLVKRGIEKK